MAVNVTQKDKTLHDTIDWCKEQIARINEMIPTASDENFLVGERFALQAVIAHCEEQLGYSGSMPLEVPNQSEKVIRLCCLKIRLACLFSGFWRDCQSCFFWLYWGCSHNLLRQGEQCPTYSKN